MCSSPRPSRGTGPGGCTLKAPEGRRRRWPRPSNRRSARSRRRARGRHGGIRRQRRCARQRTAAPARQAPIRSGGSTDASARCAGMASTTCSSVFCRIARDRRTAELSEGEALPPISSAERKRCVATRPIATARQSSTARSSRSAKPRRSAASSMRGTQRAPGPHANHSRAAARTAAPRDPATTPRCALARSRGVIVSASARAPRPSSRRSRARPSCRPTRHRHIGRAAARGGISDRRYRCGARG